ncbi:hypothetical protein [Citrobacter braakii]|uniref:hypothetical protein n=1 Tax=Citrobacter braakii TaxID=57706 RepID=UPI00403A2D45
MKKKNVFFYAIAFLVCALVAGCSNILTYIRHDEGRNITCDSQKGIKRDSGCIVVPGN